MNIPYTKDQLLDTSGRPLTQSLFLEFGYNTQYAIFTTNDEDKIYDGKVYTSLKRLYLEIGDPTEYKFAKTCLLGWRHWKRLCENKIFKPFVTEWRDELEVMIRSEGILNILEQSESNYQAAKWMSDRGWDKRSAGRPSKAEADRERRVQEKIGDSLNAQILRMERFEKKNV